MKILKDGTLQLTELYFLLFFPRQDSKDKKDLKTKYLKLFLKFVFRGKKTFHNLV